MSEIAHRTSGLVGMSADELQLGIRIFGSATG